MRYHLLAVLGLLLTTTLATAQPARGKVLILDSERTIEGDVERVGDRYCVRRSIGETWVPADKVIRLCGDMSEAYRFLAGRCNLDDADERLKLARWCHLQGLVKEALSEARAAVALKPDHADARRLLRHFEQAARAASQPATTTKPTESAPELPLAVSAEALNVFTTRVQPILMNTCASCHNGEKELQFRLHRVHEVGGTGQRGTQANLAAVLGQLDVADPSRSAFLIKAVSAHGPTGQAPLKGRQSTAYRTLEDWVKLTVSHQGPAPDRLGSRAAPLLPVATERGTFGAEEKKPSQPTETPPSSTPAPTPSARPEPVEPIDEFDPALFNRQMHPEGPPRP